jgi:hypothetical protein
MTCTDLKYESASNAVKGARKIVNPNFGFQRQLQTYFYLDLDMVNDDLLNNNNNNTKINK